MISYKLLLFIGILLGAAGQLLLKKGMMKHGKVSMKLRSLHKDLFNLYFHRYIIIGGLLFIISLGLWTIVISKLDLSYAYPLVSFNYVIVSLFSKIFFKEKITKFRWFSIFVILAGVVLVTLS
ncbi:MAG: EamA family transporter [Candidatus Nanoarchaeia archaeon]|nr:EamA family transporter [Candidatus Nanoarchaeia archaeon]